MKIFLNIKHAQKNFDANEHSYLGTSEGFHEFQNRVQEELNSRTNPNLVNQFGQVGNLRFQYNLVLLLKKNISHNRKKNK